MRITKLWIKNFKNLQDFSWELDPDYPIAVIVGKNASGKTNLLEAIITIFQGLQLYGEKRKEDSLPKFEFELSYKHEEGNVTIRNNGKLEISLNRETVPLHELHTLHNTPFKGGKDLLPRNTFVYYAGTANRLKNLIYESAKAFRWLLTGKDAEHSNYYEVNQPLFYYEPIHYRIVFLILMISPLSELHEKFLRKDFGTESLKEITFTFQRPFYAKTTNRETFWDAPPKLRKLLNYVKEKEIQHKFDQRKNEWEFTVSPESFSTDAVRDFGSEIGLFQTLNNLYLTNYLKDLQIHFRREEIKTTLEFDDLSEGEKQRIAIRGIMEIFRGVETLFLLDEPDSFAHPRWQWDFVADIGKALKTNGNESETSSDYNFSQTIYITHSPLVLSTVKENAFILDAGKIKSIEENFGQDANSSLVLMEAEKQPEKVKNDFAKYFALIEKGEGKSEEAREMRRKLDETYGLNHPELSRADMWISFYE